MGVLRKLAGGLRALLRPNARNREIQEELRGFVESSIDDKMRRGMTREEAERAARVEVGSAEMVRQKVWSVGWESLVESVWHDIRYGVRQMRRSPGFAGVAILTLALGIGANTAIFTLVQGILLRSLPVTDPSHLYRIGDRTHCCYFGSFESDDGDFDLFSYDLYRRFQDAAPEFEQLAAVEAGGAGFSVRWGSAPATAMRSEYVSGNYFSTLGVGAYAGRTLAPSDDSRSAAPVVVLSYRAWQTEFGGKANVVGSTVYIEQHPFTVAGIAPPGFYGDRIAPIPPDLWLPLSTEPLFEGANSSLLEPDTAWLYAVGRLRPNVNLGSLQAKLSSVLRQWMNTMPAFTAHGGAAEIPKQHVVLSPAGGGIQKLQQQTGTGLRMLMLLSGVVLLIACANIANLLLARSMAQRTELAVRISLGAARSRIIRQIITESLLLSVAGGALGVAIAFLGSRVILALAFPLSQNMPVSAHPSWSVLIFAFVVSLLTGLLFAAPPAWISSNSQPAEAARGANYAARDHASLPQRLLLIFQFALSIVLLTSAFLTTQSLSNLENQKMGIDATNRYTAQIDLKGGGYTPGQLNAVYRRLDDGFRALPGIVSVSFARYLPLEGNEWGGCVLVQGRPVPGPTDNCFADWDRVSPQFLDSVGASILRGRGFTDADESSGLPVVLINQAFAKEFFAHQDPLGQRFGLNLPEYSGAFQIVGVFTDFILSDTRRAPQPLFLRPMGQVYAGYKAADQQAAEESSLYLDKIVLQFKRSQPDAELLVRKIVGQVNPNVPVIRVLPYPEVVAGNFNQERLLARLTEAFGILALILASVGLYGVMSYMAARRTSEIGIRMALGASRSGIVSLMMRSAFLQILAGLAIGIPASLAVGRTMKHLLYEVSANAPLAFVGAAALLAICMAVAAFIPAVRASSLDPMHALRTE
ncbi:MAG: ABC transporter permease [Acidobacteriaceae bacterium]